MAYLRRLGALRNRIDPVDTSARVEQYILLEVCVPRNDHRIGSNASSPAVLSVSSVPER
jgi:glutamine synthetase type III